MDRYPKTLPVDTPGPTPAVPELSWLVIFILLASMLAVALFLKLRQVKKP